MTRATTARTAAAENLSDVACAAVDVGEDAVDAMVVDETGVSVTVAVDAQARQRLDSSLLETLATKFLSTR